jgi:hypothetical protein
MYRTKCGAAQSDTARFCGRCGSQMDDANRDGQAPPEQSQQETTWATTTSGYAPGYAMLERPVTRPILDDARR